MKKTLLLFYLFAFPLFFDGLYAQSKPQLSKSTTKKPDTATISKTSVAKNIGTKPTATTKSSKISEAYSALVKAIVDSLNTLPPKKDKKKLYGYLSFKTHVFVYNLKNECKLKNPDFEKFEESNPKVHAKVEDDIKYVHVDIDSLSIELKKMLFHRCESLLEGSQPPAKSSQLSLRN